MSMAINDCASAVVVDVGVPLVLTSGFIRKQVAAKIVDPKVEAAVLYKSCDKFSSFTNVLHVDVPVNLPV